jgi:hypothetical protein
MVSICSLLLEIVSLDQLITFDKEAQGGVLVHRVGKLDLVVETLVWILEVNVLQVHDDVDRLDELAFFLDLALGENLLQGFLQIAELQ